MLRILSSDNYLRDIHRMVTEVSSTENNCICMEEPAELIKTVSKLARGKYYDLDKRKGNPEYQQLWENLREEIADTLICITILQQMYKVGDLYIEDMIRHKMYRNIKRLDGEKSAEAETVSS